MIDYGDEEEPAAADETEWYHATETLESHAGRELPGEHGSRVARVSPHESTDGEGEAARHIRHILGDERYEEQVRAWQLHELQMMQTRMVRAGYF